MMNWALYARDGVALLPTTAQTEAGYYLQVEPVLAVKLGDHAALRAAIEAMLARGNPAVPTPTRAAFPAPVVLAHAKVKTWKTFARTAQSWSIQEADGKLTFGLFVGDGTFAFSETHEFADRAALVQFAAERLGKAA